MIIKRAVLHILDFNSGMSVFSQNELDCTDDTVSTFLQKHLEKLHKDSAGAVLLMPTAVLRRR